MNNTYLENMVKYENNISVYGCKDSEAYRIDYEKSDIRPAFFRDVDRIVYSLSYTRYIDKTQVFTNIQNDNISRRMTHVQMVSRIARTIGRALNLNEDLIEAAALGHDLGHAPFGHEGEKILNEISLKNNQGYFFHNVQSVRDLMCIEKNGKGSNITVQVLDAILCHNGEVVFGKYSPMSKTKEEFLKEYKDCYKDPNVTKNLKPMTLEGCVVRISDVIAYIGKDIEDAIRLGIIKDSDIPKEITNVLGNNNGEIVHNIIMDVIENSKNKNYIKMSNKVFNALNDLKTFNGEKIYSKSNTKEQLLNYRNMLFSLFDVYLNQLRNNDVECDIFKNYLDEMDEKYKNSTSIERIALDYIAGMTDDFVSIQYHKYVKQK